MGQTKAAKNQELPVTEKDTNHIVLYQSPDGSASLEVHLAQV
jgi:hypothetical protein